MNKGKVKWYNEVKGFGFIESPGMEDIFVHRTGLSGSIERLNADDKVIFEAKKGDKGMMAVNVKLDN